MEDTIIQPRYDNIICRTLIPSASHWKQQADAAKVVFFLFGKHMSPESHKS